MNYTDSSRRTKENFNFHLDYYTLKIEMSIDKVTNTSFTILSVKFSFLKGIPIARTKMK